MDDPSKEVNNTRLEESWGKNTRRSGRTMEDKPPPDDKTGVLAIATDENEKSTMESCSLHVIENEMDEENDMIVNVDGREDECIQSRHTINMKCCKCS